MGIAIPGKTVFLIETAPWRIWMWHKESNRYFGGIENFAYGEINEQSFSNPHAWSHQWDKVEALNELNHIVFDVRYM